MEDLTKHYLISGRVQGVGFRAFTKRLAGELKLNGWVRNLDDGRVEALVIGSELQLKSFEAMLSKGPPHGQVDSMQVSQLKGNETKPLTGQFEIRKDGAKPCADD